MLPLFDLEYGVSLRWSGAALQRCHQCLIEDGL